MPSADSSLHSDHLIAVLRLVQGWNLHRGVMSAAQTAIFGLPKATPREQDHVETFCRALDCIVAAQQAINAEMHDRHDRECERLLKQLESAGLGPAARTAIARIMLPEEDEIGSPVARHRLH